MNDLDRGKMSYRYYLLGTQLPVRVCFNHKGLKIGAETVDQATGQLVIKNTLLSRIETSPDAEEIDQEQFETLCRDSVKKNGHKLSF